LLRREVDEIAAGVLHIGIAVGIVRQQPGEILVEGLVGQGPGPVSAKVVGGYGRSTYCSRNERTLGRSMRWVWSRARQLAAGMSVSLVRERLRTCGNA
jgi:hypothetical protein